MTARPTSGARFVLERAGEAQAGAVVYRGFVHLPEADLPLEASVELPGGAVKAALVAPAGKEALFDRGALERTAAALLRSAVKAPLLAGAPLPRKIVRWRG